VDTLDAMTSDRPYRAALPLQAARDVIERGSGILFDPLVAAAFLRLPSETWEAIAKQMLTAQASSVLLPQIQNFRDHSFGQRSTTTFLSV
jgi:HD-GYP domain-containing protein (c-di-GMP phosphodiesterase class II)